MACKNKGLLDNTINTTHGDKRGLREEYELEVWMEHRTWQNCVEIEAANQLGQQTNDDVDTADDQCKEQKNGSI